MPEVYRVSLDLDALLASADRATRAGGEIVLSLGLATRVEFKRLLCAFFTKIFCCFVMPSKLTSAVCTAALATSIAVLVAPLIIF